MLGSLACKMDLARGILDEEGDLSSLTLKRGRQEMLKRLEQVLMHPVKTTPPPPPIPADPAAAFCESVRQRLPQHMLRCDETWLPGATEPTLLLVLQDGAKEQGPALAELLRSSLWHGTRPALHVIDAATWHAMQAMQKAGLIQIQTRTARTLAFVPEPIPAPAIV